MDTFVVFFADQDQIAVEADEYSYDSAFLTFTRHGEKVAVFYASKILGFARADAIVEDEPDGAHGGEDEDEEAF